MRAGLDPVHGRRETPVTLLELDRVVKRQSARRVNRHHDSLPAGHLADRVRRLDVQRGDVAQGRFVPGDAADGAVGGGQRRERRGEEVPRPRVGEAVHVDVYVVNRRLFQHERHGVGPVGVVHNLSLHPPSPAAVPGLGEHLHHVPAHRSRISVSIRRLQLERQLSPRGARAEGVAAEDAPVGVARPGDHLQHPGPPRGGAIPDERGDGVRSRGLQRRGKGSDGVERFKRRLRGSSGGDGDPLPARPPRLVPGRVAG